MGKITVVFQLLRTRIWFQHSLIILACIFCYGSSLHGDFVFDDAVAIVRNPDVTAPHHTLRAHILRHDFWGQNLTDVTSHKSYRPLVTLTYRWEHGAFGLQSAPMKLHNLLLHCAVCSLLLRLLPVLLTRSCDARVPFAAVALFAVHPVHTEAVSGIVGRADVLCALWFVLALLVWTRRDAARSFVAHAVLHVAMLVLATLALASKEVGVMVLPVCWALDAVLVVCDDGRRGEGEVTWWCRCGRLVRWRNWSLATMTGVLVVGRLWVMDFQAPAFRAMDNPVAAAEDGTTKMLSQLYLYVLNVWLLLCPDWLSFDWALDSIELIDRMSDPRCLVIAAFVAMLGGLVLTRSRNVLLALVLLIAPFLPASGIVRVGFVLAERVLYIPSIGFCTLIALGIERLYRSSGRLPKSMRHAMLGGFCVVLAVNALRCRWRADEWTDESLLYRSALRVCPRNAKVHYNIAKLLADRNDRPAAVHFYQQAIRLHPSYEVAHTNLGNLFREDNQLDLAESHLRKAIEIMEEFPSAWMNLGIVHAAQGKYDLALRSYHTALQYRPNYATCLYNIGNLYIALKNETLALQYWTDAVRLRPQLTKAWANILAAHDNAGRTADVFRLSEIALRLATDANDADHTAAVLFIRANAFGKLADFAEAERLYQTVIAMRPQHALYYVNLGVLYHRWGRRYEERAIEAYRQALALEPQLPSARNNLAKLVRLRRRQQSDDENGVVNSDEPLPIDLADEDGTI